MRDIEKKIRVSALEELIIKSKADQAGLTPARYTRESALGNEITIRRMSPDEKKALLELSRIGNNLNQIAKKYNQGEMMHLELVQVLAKIEKTLGDLG
jgi:hypothetical protein